jgi:hypothetical protein
MRALTLLYVCRATRSFVPGKEVMFPMNLSPQLMIGKRGWGGGSSGDEIGDNHHFFPFKG